MLLPVNRWKQQKAFIKQEAAAARPASIGRHCTSAQPPDAPALASTPHAEEERHFFVAWAVGHSKQQQTQFSFKSKRKKKLLGRGSKRKMLRVEREAGLVCAASTSLYGRVVSSRAPD
jgi:hypothetical protein